MFEEGVECLGFTHWEVGSLEHVKVVRVLFILVTIVLCFVLVFKHHQSFGKSFQVSFDAFALLLELHFEHLPLLTDDFKRLSILILDFRNVYFVIVQLELSDFSLDSLIRLLECNGTVLESVVLESSLGIGHEIGIQVDHESVVILGRVVILESEVIPSELLYLVGSLRSEGERDVEVTHSEEGVRDSQEEVVVPSEVHQVEGGLVGLEPQLDRHFIKGRREPVLLFGLCGALHGEAECELVGTLLAPLVFEVHGVPIQESQPTVVSALFSQE